ncbi:hypothetical protein BELL_0096g00070 [Botrytis elliptica]|uniref:Uncharacterized protein n=1 Tax=Botrytis elliptica TaxID=278938 RepID=A0A4Z1K8F3_9HELO|nr:hypothetical protein BELL_0096g00070 [Botrytis elliptica]
MPIDASVICVTCITASVFHLQTRLVCRKLPREQQSDKQKNKTFDEGDQFFDLEEYVGSSVMDS